MIGRVRRFSATERAAHWVQAVSFLALILTGYGLMLPAVEGIIGHRDLLREVHLSAAFFLLLGPSIVALAGDRRSVSEDIAAVDTWDADDARWFLGRGEPGRFNAGQKLNAIFVAWSTVAFGITGFILWQNRRFPLDVVARANSIHTLIAYLALAAFLGHLFLSTVYPATRPSLPGMVGGTVDEDWARAHHPRWRPLPAVPSPYEAARTTVQIAAGSFAALFAVRILLVGIGANTTDAVTAALYALTAWPGVSVPPHTGVPEFGWAPLIWLAVLVAVWLLADRLRRLPARATAAPTTP